MTQEYLNQVEELIGLYYRATNSITDENTLELCHGLKAALRTIDDNFNWGAHVTSRRAFQAWLEKVSK